MKSRRFLAQPYLVEWSLSPPLLWHLAVQLRSAQRETMIQILFTYLITESILNSLLHSRLDSRMCCSQGRFNAEHKQQCLKRSIITIKGSIIALPVQPSRETGHPLLWDWSRCHLLLPSLFSPSALLKICNCSDADFQILSAREGLKYACEWQEKLSRFF